MYGVHIVISILSLLNTHAQGRVFELRVFLLNMYIFLLNIKLVFVRFSCMYVGTGVCVHM
jgi:hypothetical protein